MTVLSSRDIDKINLVIADIYELREPQEFFGQLLKLIMDLLSSDLASINEFDADIRLGKVINGSTDHDRVFRQHETAAREYLPMHPGFGISSLNTCTKLSDLTKPADFARTKLYNEYYRHLGVQSQLFTELPARKKMRIVLMLSRGRRDFTERERFILGLIKPHVINSYRNARELHCYREKIALFEGEEDLPAMRSLGLTAREATILGWVAKGKTSADIALILGISRRTVEKHLERIYQKLGVETKMAAVSVVVNSLIPHN